MRGHGIRENGWTQGRFRDPSFESPLIPPLWCYVHWKGLR